MLRYLGCVLLLSSSTAAAIHALQFSSALLQRRSCSSRLAWLHLILSGASRAIASTDFVLKSSRKRSVITSSMDLPAVVQVQGSHVAGAPPLFFFLCCHSISSPLPALTVAR
ncbi:hypothetical protein LI328DRAFT_162829 [Trichoderma asperelloides]|nr:hypothetical protein LI328DRAFT_162829 [Trichoderma asperelloides]